MKKKLTIITVILLILLLILGAIFLILRNTKTETKVKEEESIATIYYSYSDSVDSGKEYLYIIYTSNNSYKYVLTESHTTISGPVQDKVTKGKINSKKDLEKINNKYKEYNCIISYKEEEVKSIKKLEKLLFK
jgi:uncharacterized membrane protein